MTDTTRRAFIAATTSLAALSAPGIAAAAPRHDPGLLRCIDAHTRTSNIARTWHETVYDPALDAFVEAKKAVPHYITASSYESNRGHTVHMTTASETNVAVAMSLNQDLTPRNDFERCCKELRQGAEERAAILRRMGDDWLATGLNERSDRLGQEWFAAIVAVRDYPVRTFPDLVLKVEKRQECEDEIYDLECLLADLKRIKGRA